MLKALKKSASKEDITAEEIVECKIHEITLEFLQQMQGTGLVFTIEELIEYRIHGVKPDFVRQFQETFSGAFDHEDILAAAIHNISVDYLKSFQDAGFVDWRVDDIILVFSTNQIPADYVKAMHVVGIKDAREIKKAFLDGVSIDDIQTIFASNEEHLNP